MQITFPTTLRRPPLVISPKLVNWVLCWIVLPNLAFGAMWVVGGPPRYPEIIATGVVGLVVRRASFAVRYAGFIAALVYSVLSFISGLFNLAINSLITSVSFLLEIRPSASVEYIALALCLAGTLAAAWKLLRRPTDFDLPWELLCAAAMIMTFAGFDKWMSYGTRGSYKRLAPEGAPFSSAASQTGIGQLTGDNHVLVIMVEAMGMPRETELREKLLHVWRQSDVGQGYQVSSGTTPFFGSTTNGEVRELCGRWGEYAELMEGFHSSCLPAQFAAKGYQTTAMHSFDGRFFERDQWYPNIGFQKAMFSRDLVNMGAEVCPGVFPGACDRDVPAIIGDKLKHSKSKQFIYWLTVNSHLPVPAHEVLKTDHCERFDAALAENHAMTCRLFSLWSEVGDGVARLLNDPTLPATDVLIVGDHAPPFFDRRQRTQFEPDRVPWIMLKRKPADPAAAPAAPTATPQLVGAAAPAPPAAAEAAGQGA